ncbi:MAG: phosphatase PAP2 family protein [Sediminibacterium sp.]
MKNLSTNYLKTGTIAAILVGILLVTTSLFFGKIPVFLFFNADLGHFADLFFEYFTYLGDGLIWIPIALFFIWKQRQHLVLLISTISTSTLLAQGIKNFVFTAEPRPTTLITDRSLIHTVKGVELHGFYSFPSGHTTTACCIFLLACLFLPKKWIVPIGLTYALLVGYSRVYLAQHFPLDVGGGLLVGSISVWLSFFLQNLYNQSLKQLD